MPGEASVASVEMCKFSDLGQVGPDRRDVWDGFERTDSVTAYPMVENHDTEHRKSLSTQPNKYLAPLTTARQGRHLKSAAQLWPRAGRLLVAERLWLETTRVMAMWSAKEVLSNVWWPVRGVDVQTERSLALWLNSSLGLLTMLAHRTSTRGGWVGMKKADLEELQVLDTRSLSPEQLIGLSDLFDEVAGGGVRASAGYGGLSGPASLGRRHLPYPGSPGPEQSPRPAGLRAGGLQPEALGSRLV